MPNTYIYKTINIINLVVNPENYRFPAVNSENLAIKTMLDKHNKEIKELLKDIIINGTNPSERLMVFKSKQNYITLEGNRRVTALKILKNVEKLKEIDTNYYKEYYKLLSKLDLKNVTEKTFQIDCVVFNSPEDADKWVELKHTGSNGGKGTIVWGTNEKRNFKELTSSKSTSVIPSLINYFKESSFYSDIIKQNLDSLPITNLERLLSDPSVRDAIGIDISKNVIYKLFPDNEISKPFNRILTDLINKKITVKTIYTKDSRYDYTSSFTENELPNTTTRLNNAIPLIATDNKEDVTSQIPIELNPNTTTGNPINSSEYENFSNNILNKTIKSTNLSKVESNTENQQSQEQQKKESRDKKDINKRKNLIPGIVQVKINHPRINQVYKELKRLNINDFPNSVAVLFRVLIEISMDEYIKNNDTITNVTNDSKLIKKVSACLDDLKSKKLINEDFIKPVNVCISDKDSILSINTFNSYVHNKNMYPDQTQLKNCWNQLQGFLLAILSKC